MKHTLRHIIIIALILCSGIHTSLGQTYAEKFKSIFNREDTAKQLALLQEWEKARPKDPDLYIDWFNYYVIKSMQQVISIDKTPQGDGSLELTKKDEDGLKGYVNSHVVYNSATLKKAISYIDKGISIYPNRLDMRFGKIYILGEAHDYKAFTHEIINTVNYDHDINSKWRWTDDSLLEDPANYFLSSLQDYVNTLYNSGDEQLPLMRKIAETVLKFHPDHVESLSNMAITFMVQGDSDSGLPYLLKAEKIAPTDVIVLNNIAECYSRKRDKENAKVYYQKIINVGTKDDADYARQKIKDLEK